MVGNATSLFPNSLIIILGLCFQEKEWCEEFKSCAYVDFEFLNLDDHDATRTPPTMNNASPTLETHCTPHLLESNRGICLDLCSQFECCFRQQNSCYAVNQSECDEKSMCKELFLEAEETMKGGTYSGLGATTTTTSSTTTSSAATNTNLSFESKMNDFKANLETVCSENALMTLDGIQKCHNKCQAHLCCFNDELIGPEHIDSCEDIHLNACDAYAPCKRLVTSHDFDDDDYAREVDESCQLPLDPKHVDQDWVMRCHSVCAARLCCLADANIGSNCRSQIGDEECDAYAPCEVLINPASGLEELDPQAIKEYKFQLNIQEHNGGIDEVCNEEVDNDENKYNL